MAGSRLRSSASSTLCGSVTAFGRCSSDLELTDAAAQHSIEMGSDGYFEHSSFDGTPFWKRISQFYTSSGRGYWSVGEILLWSTGPLDSAAAVAEWMASPPHRSHPLAPVA